MGDGWAEDAGVEAGLRDVVCVVCLWDEQRDATKDISQGWSNHSRFLFYLVLEPSMVSAGSWTIDKGLEMEAGNEELRRSRLKAAMLNCEK